MGSRPRRKSATRPPRPSSNAVNDLGMPAPGVRVGHEDLWLSLRQGARNVAGVTWQVAVSVHLLALSRVGELPFAAVVPEGFEDLDCRSSDGTGTFVQMKEAGAGAGRLTAADVAEALMHAQANSEGVIALVTDGGLGSGLEFTGWERTLASQAQQPVETVVAHLVGRGLTRGDAAAVVSRSHLISLPWNVREETEALLVQRLATHPTVASFAVGLLYESIARTAADQRKKTLNEAGSHAVGDVDAALSAVQSAVDVSGLDAAVAAGICAPADYLRSDSAAPKQFYLGIDGSPGHVTARLDVLRASEMRQIVEAVSSERYALIVGPSGCGKSVLLWRAARDTILGSRVVRARRVETDEHVQLLVRHVRLLEPSATSPIVVAADNLGRPGMAAWPAAVDALRELPSVLLLGACRAEDFHPHLVRGSARIVEPHLDEPTAGLLADRIKQAGLPIQMAPTEAFTRCGGLLMEFVALLLEGRRLEQVLSEQAAALSAPGRELQRAAARLVTGAHSAGLALPAGALAAALAPNGPVDPVGDALGVLNGEHILLRDGDSWRGLHELRSQTLLRLLHESPPPTLGETYCDVARLLPAAEASWLLRRVAEQYPQWTANVAQAVGDHVADASASASEVAQLLEGAERADNAVYAAACLPIIRAGIPVGASLLEMAPMIYGVRHQGLFRERTSVPAFEHMADALRQIALALPDRSSAALDAVTMRLTPDRLVELATNATLADAVRLLEAAAGTLRLTEGQVAAIFGNFLLPADPASAEAWARLIESLAAHISPPAVTATLGSLGDRAGAVARSEPSAVGLTFDVDGNPSVTIMRPPSDTHVGDAPLWDAPPAASGDQMNDMAVSVARRLTSACPEAGVVEVITITPSGARLRVADFEPGHKRMSRDVFPDRLGVRRNVGFQAAMRRLTASRSWTGVIAVQVEVARELASLIAEAPSRLKPTDHPTRRREWQARVSAIGQRAAELAPAPVRTDLELPLSHARADDADRQTDKTTRGLAETAQALAGLTGNGNRIAVAMALRKAADHLADARDASNPVVAGLGQPVPDRLIDGIERLARLAVVGHLEPEKVARLRAGDEGGLDALVSEAAANAHERQRSILERAVSRVPDASLRLVADQAPFPGNIDGTAWLVAAPILAWDSLVGALHGLSTDDRAALDCNVMAVPLDGDTALPFGIRVTHVGGRTELPITREMVEPLTDAAGIPLGDGPEAASKLSAVINAAVTMSWLVALRRRRPADWPLPADDGVANIPLLRGLASEATAALTGQAAEIAKASLSTLIAQLEAESAGASKSTLAGELLDSQGLGPAPDTEAPHVWEALAALSLVMMLVPESASDHDG